MDVYKDDIITQEDPKPKPAPLPEQHRAKLDSIVQKMISNKEPDENIRAVVDDFKQKYGQIVPQQSSPKAPVEPPSFEIKQPTYQVQLSQPTFRAIPATTVVTPSAPNEPINIEKQKDQFIPDERALKLQQKQGEARVKQDRINKELQGNDDIYEKKLREYRKDNYTIDNLRNDYKQKGQILSPQDEQTFLQREKQNQYNRPVTPEDITDFKTSTILRPNLSRKLIKDLNNPDVTHDAYKVDKYNEIASDPDPLNYMRFDKVDENAKNIKKGFLVYDPVSKQLVKPLGIIGSAIEGTMNKFKQDDKYNFYKNAPDHAIIDDLENERNKPNTDDPIPVPKGKVAEFIKEGSQMPLSPLLAGAIGSLAGPQAGTAAATAVGAYENRKAQFAATLPQVYNELRNQGVEKGEAFRRAKTQAENAQEIGTLVGAGQGLIGAEISKIPFGSAYNKAIGNVMKQNGNNIGKLFQEGLAQGAIGSTGEVLKNALAKSAGINRPVDEGALENFVYNAGMAVGIGAAIKAGKGLSKIDYKNILHGISKQPEENINAALQEKVQNGEITQTAADETQQRINEYKGLDKLIPDNVSDEARFKIQDKIKKRQEYEAQLETHDKAYHPEIKEKIKALDEDIVNLTREGKEKQVKPESGLPKDKEKEATELAEEWLHEGILPDTYGSMVKQDPIGFWKMIAQQSQNRDENWRPLPQPIDEQAVRDQFGDTVVDYAKELFPAPEAPKSNISVIQPGEIKHPETTTISPKQEIKPASENIIPNKEFQTMGMGKDEGQPETKEARNLMKQRMLQGDIPIDGEGGTGETGRGFAARVLSAWENLKRTGDNNTSLITHSSVLKAIKTWENPETWKGVEKPTDPTQMNNEQWLKFADEYNKESTNNGDLETFKGDKGDIHVIRHGQTEDNKMNKFRSGNTNLTEEGIAQAHDVGKRLQDKTGGNVPQIITSDLPRAVHTSNIIHENLKPEDEIFYTGRGKSYDDLKQTKGEYLFFSKNPKVSEWYGGEEGNVTPAKLDTSNFLDLSSQNKKAEFVKNNFTKEDILELYPDIKNQAQDDRDVRFTYEQKVDKLIDKYRKFLFENRFSGSNNEQKFLLKKIKEKGYSGVKLLDTFFGDNDMSYVVIDKNVIKNINNENLKPTENAISEKSSLNLPKTYGESKGNQDIFPERSQTQPRINRQAAANLIGENEAARLQASIDWLDAIESNNSEKSTNAEEELIRQSMAKEGQVRELLGNNDRGGEALRTSGNYGKEIGEKAKKARTRPPQESEQLRQRSGQSGTTEPPETFGTSRQIEGLSGNEKSSQLSEFEKRRVVEEVQKLPKLRNNTEKAQSAGIVRHMLEQALREDPSKTKQIIDLITENLPNHALRERISKEISLGQTSRNRPSMGARVPESGEVANAQTGGFTKEGQSTGEKVEPEYGDLPFKAEEGDDIITSIKNATTREKIEQYGLTPALQEVKRTHAEVWQNALNRIAKGFDTQSLVDQLKKKPRPLTDEEDALLLIHQIQKEAAYDAANKEINEAAETGDYGTWEEAHLRRTALRDDLQDIYDIGKKVGTLNARGLSARQMIADRRYSLVNMEEEYRAAQRGEALTADQKADIERIHGEIRKAKDAYEARIKQLEGENEKLRQQAIEKKIQREVKKEKIQKNIENIKKDLSANLDELRKIARNQGLGANPIALEAIPVIAKATKNLAKLGIVKIEQMAVHLYDALKDDYGKDKDGNYNLTVDHVMEAIEAANNQQRLDAYKKRISQNIDELTGKLNQENVPNKPAKAPIILDDQAIKLKAQEERLKAQYEEKVKKAELKNRTPFQKVQDTFVKWQRAFKLSHVTTLGKLSGAGLTRLLSTPIEEGVGGAVSAVLPKLAQRAEGEGGLNIKAEAQAITSAFTKGMKDAAQTLKLGTKGGKGKSDLDIVFGKKDALPPEAIDFFGQLHSALKAPVKRAAFERSFAKRVARNIKNGVDVSDPLVQARIATEAYKDGQRAIFMQDNFVSDSYRNWVNSLERSQKYPTAGKIAATTFQWMVPFVKVPTNIVGEVGSHVAGIPIGAAKLIHASFTKGLENLAPEEADMIMRNLKKGSVGAAALLMGYFNPNNFGGYYQKGEKRSDSDVGVGEAKVFGMTIPKWLLHAPIYETMQLGATIRRVKDKMVKGEPQGLGEGIWAGALGLAEEEPLIDQPMRIAKIFENKYQREKYFGELAKGTFDPGLLQDIAKWTDPQAKRKPEGIVESVEMGIPGLREEVGDGSANTGGGAGAGGTYGKPNRIKPEKPHKTHR